MYNLHMWDRELMAALVLGNTDEEYSMDDLKSYMKYIASAMPLYTTFSVSEDSIESVCECFPDIFTINHKKNTFKSGCKPPNPKYFFLNYAESIIDYIRRVTKTFLDSELQNERNKRAKARLLGME